MPPLFKPTNVFPSYTPKCEIRDLEQLAKSFSRDLSTPHYHDYYMLLWVTNGEGCYSIDFNDSRFATNTVLFVSPGQIHCFKDFHDIKGWVVCFEDDSFLLDEKDNSLIKSHIYELFDKATTIHVDVGPDEITQLFLSLHEEMQNPYAHAHYEMVMCLLKILLIQIDRHSAISHLGITEANYNNEWNSFNRFRRTLEFNYHKVHTVSDYAKLMGITARSLANITHNAVGAQPLKMINNRIVLEAKRLLAYSSKPIKEIAYSLGFTSISHFSKMFSTQTGVSPLEFRNNNHVEDARPLDFSD